MSDSKRPHIVDGEFQSDKYPTCPAGKVPISVKDPTAQDLLWEYAQRRRVVDAEFADDLEFALTKAGYTHRAAQASSKERMVEVVREAIGHHVTIVSSRTISAIASRVAYQLATPAAAIDRLLNGTGVPAALSAEDREVLQRMRMSADRSRDEWLGWPTEKMYADEVAVLDRLLGAKP